MVNDAPHARSPKPIFAALLNLWFGLGQIYAGQLVFGLIVSQMIMVWFAGLNIASTYLDSRALRLTTVTIAFASHVVGLPILGYLAARRARPQTRRVCQRWYVLLAIAVLILAQRRVFVAIAPAFSHLARVEGQSMRPTLLHGDRLISQDDPNPRRGDIVMVLVPNALHVRRVVGLPGDTVELRDFHAIVNGRPEQPRLGPCEHEDSPATWSEATRARGNWGPVVVPEGHYALFGDCRDNAYDTRQQAFPTRAQIGQRLSWIFFSRDTSGMRWDRIGQRVQ